MTYNEKLFVFETFNDFFIEMTKRNLENEKTIDR